MLTTSARRLVHHPVYRTRGSVLKRKHALAFAKFPCARVALQRVWA